MPPTPPLPHHCACWSLIANAIPSGVTVSAIVHITMTLLVGLPPPLYSLITTVSLGSLTVVMVNRKD